MDLQKIAEEMTDEDKKKLKKTMESDVVSTKEIAGPLGINEAFNVIMEKIK